MKIIGIGKNYVEDRSEIENIKDGLPIIFTKPETTLVTNNKDVLYPSCSNAVVYEVELVIKIGKTGKNISEEEATNYISEIGIGIDYTAKDILEKYQAIKGPWALAKGFDGASPVSSFEKISEFKDLNNINFNLKINGQTKQIGNTSLMIYNFNEIIAYVSTIMTLEEGDLIFTGTPAIGADLIFKKDHLQASLENDLLLDFKMI